MNVLRLLQGVFMTQSSSLKTLGSVIENISGRAQDQTDEFVAGQSKDEPLIYRPGYVRKPEQNGKEEDVEVIIERLARKHGVAVDVALTFARIESDLDPKAVSPTGAIGLFQLTRSAISEVRRVYPSEYYDPPGLDLTDPQWNANVGILFIKLIAKHYVRVPIDETYNIADLTSVYAAYNVGIGNYRKLENGQYYDPELKKAVSLQARKLSSKGPRGYLASVERVLTNYLV